MRFEQSRRRSTPSGPKCPSDIERGAALNERSTTQDVADLAGDLRLHRVPRTSRIIAGQRRHSGAGDRRGRAAVLLRFSAASSLATWKLDKIALLVSGLLNSWFNGTVVGRDV